MIFAKLSKKLLILTPIWVLSLSVTSQANPSEIRNCGLKGENSWLDQAQSNQKVTPKWGVNIIDFVRYIAHLPAHAPRKVADVLTNLRTECLPSRIAANGKLAKACEFLKMHSEFVEAQNELQTLLADGTFIEHPENPDELVFRGLNWSLNPFSENVAAHPGERSRAVKAMVQWMLKRKALASHIDAVGTYYASLRSPRSASTLHSTIPAIKAYYSSPLFLGQIAYFLKNQQCKANKLPACSEANRQLTTWMIEQVQEAREKLLNIKCLFESRLAQLQASGSAPIELELLNQLYKHDQAFGERGEAVVEQYMDYLDKSAAAIYGVSDDFAVAKLGLIVASEILHVFQHAIPAQPPLASEIIHPDLAAMEMKISEEINDPINNLLYFIDQFERTLQ